MDNVFMLLLISFPNKTYYLQNRYLNVTNNSYYMSEKYVLFVPQGGLNDCFTRINITISYCELTNRTLLLDFTRSEYRINFFDYFLNLLHPYIIYKVYLFPSENPIFLTKYLSHSLV